MFTRLSAGLVVLLALASLAGCAGPDDGRANFGKTYYIDGAGNWGFGVSEIAKALQAAGYKGSVEAYMWTTSFNPAIDQINRPAARIRAAGLSDKIRNYLKTYPDNDVNIIALSAGTGVATWAVEALPKSMKVNNMVLLGSSLSSTYDMARAFEHIRGHVFVYYSQYDPILSGPVRILGTIDGSLGEPAGLVGFHPKGGLRGKVTNYAWRPEYAEYGWAGGHTDSTSEPFVRRFISQHIVSPGSTRRSVPARADVGRMPRYIPG
jgi:pimeloyl-ACP methyl ester carboxylesterase